MIAFSEKLLSPVRFGFSLLSALRNPYSPGQAQADLKLGIAGRVNHFLGLCDSQVFSRPRGIFGSLFSAAGISRGQLRELVMRLGVENTLRELAMRGVFLDIEEFKGRKPVIRPGLRMTVNASDLDMAQGPSIPFPSSGSRGAPRITLIHVPGLKLLASCIPPILGFLNADGLPVVLYYPMPSGSGFMHLITFSMAGKHPSAWFAQTMPSPWWGNKAGMKLAALAASCRMHGISLSAPRLADIGRPVVMAEWLLRNCPKGAVVPTFTGSALHLVLTATREGIKMPPLVFLLGGEPLTERKLRALEQQGHRVFPWYSSVETGRLALGCLSPRRADEMHLLDDRIACIVRRRTADATGGHRPALLFTTVQPDAYKFILNVETGDEAVMGEGSCGCPWESMGFFRRLHGVRSFEKLTLEGISLVADFLSALVEEEIPSRCGGTPADYQFTEEEDAEGVTRLVLSVSPAVKLHTTRIRSIVQDLFSEQYDTAGVLLSQASSIIVRREFPKLTPSGKILAVRSLLKGSPN